ncbi:MAG TPA: bifunctional serine/threonine-protein kinase/formylglycine-generating enzyme family protein, partial [Candidatus Krumholzibacteria bacterium]|nr:bifunctional serine/threonine-protein kinase/formylglycine-generating enzyme family protein [Candidatus Krumholzibacteria bacterium]
MRSSKGAKGTTVDNARFRKVQEIFQRALEAPEHERAQVVFGLCRDDWDLYREVTSLLHHHSNDGWDPGSDPSLVLQPPPRPRLEESRTLSNGNERYELIDTIGEGGMGIVYLAEQTHPVRRRVALKVIKIGVDSRRGAARFEFERQALAMMDHPSIARVYEAGATEDGRLYFAMEYVAGEPITEFCDSHSLGIRERVHIMASVCDAIQHAHQRGIIHRDIKPSNILVTRQGGAPVPKIIDFGVARATNQRMAEHTMFTQLGVVVGSLHYMSPEQADCRLLEIDTRTDVYSLGAVLYELLTGETPIDMPTIEQTGYAELQRRIREEEPARPSDRIQSIPEMQTAAAHRGCDVSAWRRQLSGDLDWITLKALEKDRERRYATAAQFGADLQRHLGNQPVEAGPPSRRYRLAKFVRRNRLAVISSTAVALALILGLATSTTLFVENRASRRLAEAQRDEILRLSDANVLARLVDEVSDLRPPHPEKAAAMREWLARAQSLAERLPLHRRTLDELRSQGTSVPGQNGAAPSIEFSDQEREFHYLHLKQLVADLEVFVDPDPHVGAIARVRDRLAFAESIRERSIDAPRAAWSAAIHSIADTRACPRYGGLVIEPQIGLLPLGRDAESGLWEFAHLRSGKPALRGSDGKLIMAEETGIVLVLMPGDCFAMGMSAEMQADGTRQADFDRARDDQLPVHRVCLDPFFMSKYEVTQAQWLRLTGTNPSHIQPYRDYGTYVTSLRHPVENLNWQMAEEFAHDIGLVVPTEAQWEYAARAGSPGPYYCGRDYHCLETYENILDETARVPGRPGGWRYAPWFDGFVDSSPVGFYAPNAFGLYDMLGNVTEWTHDWFGSYTLPVAPGTGERLVPRGTERVVRGGAYYFFWERISCQMRFNLKPHSFEQIGVRLARGLDEHPTRT